MDRKIFGLPLPVVGGILGLILVGIIYLRRSSVASSSASGTPGVNTDVAGALEGDGSANGDATSSTGASTIATYSTNALWEAAVVAWLTTQGNSPLTAEIAVEDYLNGVKLTPAQSTLVNQAIAKFGVPPEGVQSTPSTGTGDGTTVAKGSGLTGVTALPYINTKTASSLTADTVNALHNADVAVYQAALANNGVDPDTGIAAGIARLDSVSTARIIKQQSDVAHFAAVGYDPQAALQQLASASAASQSAAVTQTATKVSRR